MLEHGDHYSKWPEEDRAYLQQLKRENKKMHTMVANALESISNNQEEIKNAQIFDVVPLINDEAVSCATGARRMADLKTLLPNKIIEVQGNPQQLTVVLDNVIENAFHYTEKGTPVSVSVSEENYKVTIVVEDKGKGMTQDQQKKLFKLFTRLDSRITGKHDESEELYSMGLGLYVARLIVERHRGALELESTPKQGTKVIITLFKRLI
jgi:signal transduction histidine kinase